MSNVCMNFNMSRDYPVSGTKYKIQFDDLFVSQITIIYWFRVLSSAVWWQSIGLPWLFPVIVHRKFHWDCPWEEWLVMGRGNPGVNSGWPWPLPSSTLDPSQGSGFLRVRVRIFEGLIKLNFNKHTSFRALWYLRNKSFWKTPDPSKG